MSNHYNITTFCCNSGFGDKNPSKVLTNSYTTFKLYFKNIRKNYKTHLLSWLLVDDPFKGVVGH